MDKLFLAFWIVDLYLSFIAVILFTIYFYENIGLIIIWGFNMFISMYMIGKVENENQNKRTNK